MKNVQAMPDELKRITDAPDIVKRAVKEALDDKKMDDIGKQLTDLATQMTAGFSAVHARQDAANGKLIKHELDISTMKTRETSSSLYTNMMWFAITALVGMVTYFITRP